MGAVTQFGDGQPIATPNGTLNPWFNQRPNLAGRLRSRCAENINEWFNYSCMSEPTNLFAAGTAGPILPGIRANGARNLDLSLAKHFKFGEQRDLEVRAAAYNLTNSVSFWLSECLLGAEEFR